MNVDDETPQGLEMILRHTLAVLGVTGALFLPGAGPTAASAQVLDSYSVTGRVHDDGNTPVTSVEVKLTRNGRIEQAARTGSDGRFAFNGVYPGELELSIRRLGYRVATRSITINAGVAPSPLDIALETVATEVPTVLVEGEDPKLHDFYVRRNSNNFGKYFDADEIARRDPRIMSEMLRTVPGASVGAGTRIGNRVLLRGCKPTIWVNGMKAFGAELDEVANPSDVAGLEVYLSWAGLPPQFQDRANPGCGAIMVWTKDQ